MTTAELRKAEVQYQLAVSRALESGKARDRMIVEAIEAGWTHARIAEATRLTRGRIGQIATEAREWRDKQTQKRSSK